MVFTSSASIRHVRHVFSGGHLTARGSSPFIFFLSLFSFFFRLFPPPPSPPPTLRDTLGQMGTNDERADEREADLSLSERLRGHEGTNMPQFDEGRRARAVS